MTPGILRHCSHCQKILKYLETTNSNTILKTPTDRTQAVGSLQSLPRIWTRDKREQIQLVARARLEPGTAGLRVRSVDHLAVLAASLKRREVKRKEAGVSAYRWIYLRIEWYPKELSSTRSPQIGFLLSGCISCLLLCDGFLKISCHRKQGALATTKATATRMSKKAIGLLSKTTNLHVHHTFLVTFLCRLCTTTTRKCIISRFMEDVNKRRRMFLSLSKI